MERQALSILVQNEPNVLMRIAAAFGKRGVSIDTLAAGAGHDESETRITVTFTGDEKTLSFLSEQVKKLLCVLDVTPLPPTACSREYALLRVPASPQALAAAQAQGAELIAEKDNSLYLECGGAPGRVQTFLEAMQAFSPTALSRTGLFGLPL